MTAQLKEAIILAAEAAGDRKNSQGLVGYLTWLALKHPGSFCTLLGRILTAEFEKRTALADLSSDEIKDELLQRGALIEVLYNGEPVLMFVDGGNEFRVGQAGHA